MNRGRFYITTPLDYVNDVPHLGHAFEVIGIDVQARYRRLLGYDVHLLTGTDEHGQKIANAAEKHGMSPQAFTDKIAAEFERVWSILGISYDDFIRTTSERHKRGVAEIWKRSLANGDIYLGKYEGWYDVKEEAFITETEMKDKGLEPDGVRIRRFAEDAYFFRLSKYKDAVLAHIQAHPEFIMPESRRNEVLNSFLGGDMPDLCVSRTTLKWGIPVPDAPGHVIYVWFDALTNYISAIGFGQPDGAEQFAKLWPADLHVIGKDILKFHCVYWPAFLLSAGLPLPKQVFGHGFITVQRKGSGEAEKMSKSAGNSVDPLTYVARTGAEPLRYFLMREINYGSDGIFSEEALELRFNADLANGLGNLLSRTTAMAERYCGGKLRRTTEAERTEIERELLAKWNETVAEYERAMPRFEYHAALSSMWEFVTAMNTAIARVEPWALAKKPENAERLVVFLSALAEGLAGFGALLSPFMPETSKRLRAALALGELPEWEEAKRWGTHFDTIVVAKAEPLFPRLEPPKE